EMIGVRPDARRINVAASPRSVGNEEKIEFRARMELTDVHKIAGLERLARTSFQVAIFFDRNIGKNEFRISHENSIAGAVEAQSVVIARAFADEINANGGFGGQDQF